MPEFPAATGGRRDTRPRAQFDEALEVLVGARTQDKKGAAVRIRDMVGIFQIPQTLAANAAAGAPTKAEYDALLRDVEAISTALRLVADAMHRRLNREDLMQHPHT